MRTVPSRSILLAAFFLGSCAFWQEKYCPPRPPQNEQLPVLAKLLRPEVQPATFSKEDVAGLRTIDRPNYDRIVRNVAALVDVVNRYEKLVDAYNKVARPVAP